VLAATEMIVRLRLVFSLRPTQHRIESARSYNTIQILICRPPGICVDNGRGEEREDGIKDDLAREAIELVNLDYEREFDRSVVGR